MVSAFVLVRAAQGADAKKAHEAAHKIPGVKTVHFTYGAVDGIVFLEVADMNALAQTVAQVRNTPGVERTETLIVMPV